MDITNCDVQNLLEAAGPCGLLFDAAKLRHAISRHGIDAIRRVPCIV